MIQYDDYFMNIYDNYLYKRRNYDNAEEFLMSLDKDLNLDKLTEYLTCLTANYDFMYKNAVDFYLDDGIIEFTLNDAFHVLRPDAFVKVDLNALMNKDLSNLKNR